MTITEQRETDIEPGTSSKLESSTQVLSSSPYNRPRDLEHQQPIEVAIETEVVETLATIMPPSDEVPLLRKTTSLRNMTSSASLVMDDNAYACDFLGGSLPDDLGRVSNAVHSKMRRSQSCGVRSEAYRHCGTGVRLNIGYRDENLRERCQRNTHELLQTAANQATVQSTSTILARKALRYRRIMERMQGADVSNPAFDLTEHLGVRWQRVIPPPVPIDQEEEEEEDKEEVREEDTGEGKEVDE